MNMVHRLFTQQCKCIHSCKCMLCENNVRNKNPKSLQVVQSQSVCVCVCVCVHTGGVCVCVYVFVFVTWACLCVQMYIYTGRPPRI